MSEAKPLDRLRRVARADVYKKGQLAATLERQARSTTFAYRPEYRGAAVASTLPVGDAPIELASGAVPTFFAGLLPEGRRLVALHRATKTSIDDDLTLLLAVGADTIGDVQIVPAGEPPALPRPMLSEGSFDSIRFADLFSSVTGGVDAVGLPGVQEKVSASRLLSVPLATDAGPSILKLTPREYPHLVRNEAFFLECARRCGIEAASAAVVRDAQGDEGLLVSRFDRSVHDGAEIELLTQEDACQACDRYPADKYNITTEEAIASLARLAPASRVAALSLMRQFAFAYLTGNGDMHAKNLSVVERQGELRAAPAYDVPTTYPYGDTTMAMSIDGRDREDITRKSFVALGDTLGIPRKAVAAMLDALLARIDRVVIDELHQLPFDDRIVHKLGRLMRDRVGKLRAG